MYTEELFKIQREWSETALFVLRELLPLMAPVAQYKEWTDEERDTLGMLLSASARSSESVMLLNAYGQLWDAEVVLRSVFEGSLKFVYLLQREREFKQRYKEYANDLFQIALLKDHQKARDLLDVVPDPDARKWKPIWDRLLQAAEVESIERKYEKSIRRSLDTKWGFTGIVQALTRSGDPAVARLAGLAHGYSIASHVQHADYVGTSMPLDRDRRRADKRDTIHLAHLARLISDTFTCLQMRLAAGYRYVGHDPWPLIKAEEKIDTLHNSLGAAYDNWMNVEYGSAPDNTASKGA